MSVEFESEKDYTLEDILAEIKSDAFIADQRKTPKSDMDEAVGQIIREMKSLEQSTPPLREDNTLPLDPNGDLFEQVYARVYDGPAEEKEAPADSGARDTGNAGLPEVEPEPEESPREPDGSVQPVSEPLDPNADLYEQVFNRVYEQPKKEEEATPGSENVQPDETHTVPEPAAEVESAFVMTPEPEAGPETESEPAPEPVSEGEQPDEPPEQEAETFDEEYDRLQDQLTGTIAASTFEEYGDEVEGNIDDEDRYAAEGRGVLSILDYLRARGDEPEPEEEELPEPEYDREKRRFEKLFAAYTWRVLAGGVLAVLMAVFTFIFEAGNRLPFGIGNSGALCAGFMTILLLAEMLLALDIIASGLNGLVHGRPSAATLVAISACVSVLAGLLSLLDGKPDAPVPFSVVCAFALVFAMWGERTYCRAYAGSLRTVLTIRQPKGVVSEYSDAAGQLLLKKYNDYSYGFYNNMMNADYSEKIYRIWAPLLLVLCAVCSLILCAEQKSLRILPQMLSATGSAAAGFSGLLCFSRPFDRLVARLRLAGSAVAGWGGCCDLTQTGGVRMTDTDLFPSGSVHIDGMKVFREMPSEDAIRYTASMISESQSGLAAPFEELANAQQVSLVRVSDFSCYEGGIGGTIRGESVLVGSEAFMKLMGVAVPEELNLSSAVYTAVNRRLRAVFSLTYTPITSVRGAVEDILGTDAKMLFAVRDFNITPLLLRQKFRLDMDGVDYLPIAETYSISDPQPGSSERVCAVVFREGLGPFAEVITGARRLYRISRLCTSVSVGSSILGVGLLFFLNSAGAAASAGAGNLLIYLLCMCVIVLLLAGFVKND